jgi:hypothetical protein
MDRYEHPLANHGGSKANTCGPKTAGVPRNNHEPAMTKIVSNLRSKRKAFGS